GETGTGKELAARAIHYLSARQRGPFVAINCGALPDSILEAELFGHTRGAYTDAKSASRGVIGGAEGGTLFLDEIDALSARAQAAILRFMQDHSYRPLGAARTSQADVRVVCATNVDLAALAAHGAFRQDLLYRINLLSVPLPSLREREGDALLLAQAFVQRLLREYGSPPRELHPASVAHLRLPLPWPGNVRELEHRVHRAFLLGPGREIDLELDAVAATVAAAPAPEGAVPPNSAECALTYAAARARALVHFERQYLSEVLERAGGNLSRAARLAGKERSRFGKLVRKHGLQRTALGSGNP
ncbi:MAG: sigma 54-interacting transcriptional regulator, partial [Rubrivivax sp.]|nr:sigma 54-interacting transcriptional regulator [Rubrivivax sp.]